MQMLIQSHSLGLITLILDTIHFSTTYPRTRYMLRWVEDLVKSLSDEDWGAIWETTANTSRNILAIENSYKVLFRWYLTTARLAIFAPQYPLACFQACSQEDIMLHIAFGGVAQKYIGYGLVPLPSSIPSAKT